MNTSATKYPRYKQELPKDKPPYREISEDNVKDTHLSADYAMQPKIDGAHNLLIFDKKKTVRAISHRPRKGIKGVIDHTWKVPALSGVKTPEGLHNTVVRGEIWAKGKDGRAIPASLLSGLLNAGVAKSREQQDLRGTKLRMSVFDVDKFKGKDYRDRPYDETLEALRQIKKQMPELDIPPTVSSEKAKHKLSSRNSLLREKRRIYRNYPMTFLD